MKTTLHLFIIATLCIVLACKNSTQNSNNQENKTAAKKKDIALILVQAKITNRANGTIPEGIFYNLYDCKIRDLFFRNNLDSAKIIAEEALAVAEGKKEPVGYIK